MTISLGKRYSDSITGYVGIAICHTMWLNGCDRVTLQAPMTADGKVPEPYTCDDVQVTLVDEGVPDTTHKRGGGRNDAVAISR